MTGAILMFSCVILIGVSLHLFLSGLRQAETDRVLERLAAGQPLLAEERGLATCAQGFWRLYSDMLVEHLALPAGYQIAFGIALGYEDTAAPINQWRASRAPSQEWLILKGWD